MRARTLSWSSAKKGAARISAPRRALSTLAAPSGSAVTPSGSAVTPTGPPPSDRLAPMSDDDDDDLFGSLAAAPSAGPAPAPAPAPETVSGLMDRDCAGLVAMHAAAIGTRCEDTKEEAQSRADIATRAVRKAICSAARQDPAAWQDPVTTLESLLYPKSNDTTRESVGSVANITQSPLAPQATLTAVDDLLVHATERTLPVGGGYGQARPIAGGRMLIEGRGDAAPPPCVTLTFPLSDPHFPFRCARINIIESATGLLRVTVHAESDRRLPAPSTGVTIGPEEGAHTLSAASIERLFAPSQSPAVARRCTSAGWWIGLYDVDAGLQRRLPEGSLGGEAATYVVPTFLTRALAHLATRNLRLHVVANAAATGQGGKLAPNSLWRSVVFDPATLHARAVRGDDDHAFYLRAPLHKTYCGCLCGAYAPLVAGGHAHANGCEPCLDIYTCGRPLVGGRCPTHAEGTRAGAHGVCVARTSARLKCVHRAEDAPPATSTLYATYNSLDHELLLAPIEKNIVREIAASAVHLRRCATAATAASAHGSPPTEVPGVPDYLRAERSRLGLVLPELYDRNDERERVDTADVLMHGVEWFLRHPEHQEPGDPPYLQTLDDRATQLMCTGDFTVEIGEDPTATEGSFPDRGQLRVQPQIARLHDVTKLWRRPARDGGGRTRMKAKYGKEIEYIYGRLFEHRRAPKPKRRPRCAPPACGARRARPALERSPLLLGLGPTIRSPARAILSLM